MIDEILLAMVSAIVLIAGVAIRPHRAACPQGFSHQGVRLETGRFDCRRPPGKPDWTGTGPDLGVVPLGTLSGRIYCTGGTSPVVVSERIVGCQRGGWRQ